MFKTSFLRLCACSFLVAGVAGTSFADAPVGTAADSTTGRAQALRIYLDCTGCDQEFIRSEVRFVNYVRDRVEAQVHVLVTRQRTGSGGEEHTLTLLGVGDLAGKEDTLRFAVADGATKEEIRRETVRLMKLGLMSFVARTPLASRITIGYESEEESPLVADVWDSWVFKTSVRGWFNGEESHAYVSLYPSLSASRVTPEMKLRIAGWGNYADDRFEIDDRTLRSISRGWGGETYAVLSLDDHWSWGGEAEVSSSTFSNRKMAVTLGPALEYNLFPYSESTRRQLRLAMQGVYKYVRYREETIFDQWREHLLRGELSVAFEMIQPWGSVEVRVSDSHYLHDLAKNRVELYMRTALKLVEGLSVEGDVSFSMVHDQLELPKSGVSTEEILLQRRQLATQYQYWASLGISYSFGSIYNNVVNPRFGE